jgi:hypothetical protein
LVGVVAGWNITTKWFTEWFGTLLGPEKTPRFGGCVFSGCSWPGPSNASFVGVVVVVGVGVWLCVECCIVDASILL